MTSLKTNTANLLNEKSLKLNILPSYFHKYEVSKCHALTKAETFNPHKVVTNREKGIFNIFEQYELVSRTNTGLSIVQKNGKIYLFGEADQDYEYDQDCYGDREFDEDYYEDSKFKVVVTDWTNDGKKKHRLIFASENINLFVDECIE